MPSDLTINRADVLKAIEEAQETYPFKRYGESLQKILDVLTVAHQAGKTPLSTKQVGRVLGLDDSTVGRHCLTLKDDKKIIGQRFYSNGPWLWSLPTVTNPVTNDDSCKETST
jgi:hypothetical protein